MWFVVVFVVGVSVEMNQMKWFDSVSPVSFMELFFFLFMIACLGMKSHKLRNDIET